MVSSVHGMVKDYHMSSDCRMTFHKRKVQKCKVMFNVTELHDSYGDSRTF